MVKNCSQTSGGVYRSTHLHEVRYSYGVCSGTAKNKCISDCFTLSIKNLFPSHLNKLAVLHVSQVVEQLPKKARWINL